jgi:hypothetical protein|tara:strand:+ start:1041 stop:1220 length:180 start_codon:yes stop_codon:yes gene_type:complete
MEARPKIPAFQRVNSMKLPPLFLRPLSMICEGILTKRFKKERIKKEFIYILLSYFINYQ